MFRSRITPWSIFRAPHGYKRGHESVADRFRYAFDNVERVDSLINGFPFGVFEGTIPNIPELERRRHETAAVTNHSHVKERIVKELSVRVRDVLMFFFSEELFLASLDVRDN